MDAPKAATSEEYHRNINYSFTRSTEADRDAKNKKALIA